MGCQYSEKLKKKYVYLFELDSVRKTDEEILEGQKALYNEIVVNGNIVVLTYNQLVDSRGFFSLLADQKYYHNILELFKRGAICISQFGDIRTVSQYLINSTESDKQFIYSALPLKGSQKRLLALVRRSLMYSDLSEIYAYTSQADNQKNDAELRTLFAEVEANSRKVRNTNLHVKQMREIMDNLYWLLSIVLRLSVLHEIYISPRDKEEYKNLKLYNILKIVTDMGEPGHREFQLERDIIKELEVDYIALWNEAISLIKALDAFDKKVNDRSVYLRELLEMSESKKETGLNKVKYQYAEAIINICYNYACEISICNISKHYNVEELREEHSELTTFKADFAARLQQYWKKGWKIDQRFLLTDTNVFEKFTRTGKLDNFFLAVKVTDYAEYGKQCREGKIHRYEEGYEGQKRQHKRKMEKSILTKIVFAFFAIVFAVFFSDFLGILQNQFMENNFPEEVVLGQSLLNKIWIHIANRQFWIGIPILIVTELISVGIALIIPNFISLSDALQSIASLVIDMCKILLNKASTYINTCTKNISDWEDRAKEKPIDYTIPQRLKKYMQYNRKSDIFKKTANYQIADANDPIVMKKLLNLEEDFGYQFGEAYRSKYHTVVVDPIYNKAAEEYYPYERMLSPKSDCSQNVKESEFGKGVVIIPKIAGKFILLEQERHAIREKQYAFPRGFSEDDNLYADAKRELEEELDINIPDEEAEAETACGYKVLGKICPDSGAQGTFADVCYIEAATYQVKSGYEGIVSVKAVTEEELQRMIRDGQINDGFTLGAYVLYEHNIGKA